MLNGAMWRNSHCYLGYKLERDCVAVASRKRTVISQLQFLLTLQCGKVPGGTLSHYNDSNSSPECRIWANLVSMESLLNFPHAKN